jgi:hypothetical protein
MADNFWASSQPTARGYRLSATLLASDPPGGKKEANGFVVTVHSTVLLGRDAEHHTLAWDHSRLVIPYIIAIPEALRLLEHWASYYDPELKAHVAELAAKLGQLPPLPPSPGGGGPQVVFEAKS